MLPERAAEARELAAQLRLNDTILGLRPFAEAGSYIQRDSSNDEQVQQQRRRQLRLSLLPPMPQWLRRGDWRFVVCFPDSTFCVLPHKLSAEPSVPAGPSTWAHYDWRGELLGYAPPGPGGWAWQTCFDPGLKRRIAQARTSGEYTSYFGYLIHIPEKPGSPPPGDYWPDGLAVRLYPEGVDAVWDWDGKPLPPGHKLIRPDAYCVPIRWQDLTLWCSTEAWDYEHQDWQVEKPVTAGP
jgi:hypothetical protein